MAIGDKRKGGSKQRLTRKEAQMWVRGKIWIRGREIEGKIGRIDNQAPKGCMWSATPFALLSVIVDEGERKQGRG